MVNTGFVPLSSRNDIWEDLNFLQRVTSYTNEHYNLFFEKISDRYEDGTREDKISGMITGTYSEIDLRHLYEIF